jgi:trigger factor
MEFYQGNPEMRSQLQAPILEDKVVDFILALADVTERKVPVEELTRDPDEEEEGGGTA